MKEEQEREGEAKSDGDVLELADRQFKQKKRERDEGREGEKLMNRRRTGVRETDARGGRLQGVQ